MDSNNKGFTLVELIIVVAIIAVLATVLAPQYLQYVERSRESSDVQQAAQIMDAAMIAVVDAVNAGEIPPGTIVQVGWVTTEAASRGEVYIGEARVGVESSAILPSDYVTDAGDVFSGARDRLCSILGVEASNRNFLTFKYCEYDVSESAVASESTFRFHLNTATGEIALAAPSSDPAKNVWVDELGMKITRVP